MSWPSPCVAFSHRARSFARQVYYFWRRARPSLFLRDLRAGPTSCVPGETSYSIRSASRAFGFKPLHRPRQIGISRALGSGTSNDTGASWSVTYTVAGVPSITTIRAPSAGGAAGTHGKSASKGITAADTIVTTFERKSTSCSPYGCDHTKRSVETLTGWIGRLAAK